MKPTVGGMFSSQAPGPSGPTLTHDVLQDAMARYRAGRRPEAEKICWKAVRAQTGDKRKQPGRAEQAEIAIVLAGTFLASGDPWSASDLAKRAISLAPRSAPGHALLAASLGRTNRADEALEAAEKAMAVDPAFFEAYLAATEVLLETGRPEDAEARARAAVEKTVDRPAAYLLLARVLRSRGNDEAALESLQAAAGLGPAEPHDVHCRIGHIHNDWGRFDDAAKAYRTAIALRPAHAEAHAGLVNTLMAAGRMGDAVKAYRRGMEEVPGYSGSHFDLLFPLNATEGMAQPKEAPDSRHAVLASGLFVFPNLPLGIAFIKAYAETMGDYRVTCHDLSQHWFNAVIRALDEGTAAFRFEDEQDFVAAAKLFQGGGAGFYDDASQNAAAECMSKYRSLVCDFLDRRCTAIHKQDGALPWYVLDYARRILSSNPAVVGLSVTFTNQFHFSALLARAIKTLAPHVTVVFGGGFFNKVNLEGFLARPFVDYVILNEGETAFLQLLEALNGKGSVAEIPGIAFRDGEGRYVIEENDFSIKHDTLPYADFSDFDLGAYFNPEPVIPLISSRGCYWRRCTFCDHFASFAGTYKVQSITRVVDEIEHHIKTSGARHFTFVDEMISAKRFKKISDEILARGLDLVYYALAKPTADFTPEIMETMYRAGCRCIYWGQESGNERMLELMDKGNTVESSRDTLRIASEAGIRNHLFMIVGFPSETRDDLDETLGFLYENRTYVDKILANPFVLKKGTPTFDQSQRFGITQVFDTRSICHHELIRYHVGKNMIGSAEADRMCHYLQAEYFDLFSARGRYFGTPRDHIIVIYGDTVGQLANTKNIPPPDRIKQVLDGGPASLPLPGQSTLYPEIRFDD